MPRLAWLAPPRLRLRPQRRRSCLSCPAPVVSPAALPIIGTGMLAAAFLSRRYLVGKVR